MSDSVRQVFFELLDFAQQHSLEIVIVLFVVFGLSRTVSFLSKAYVKNDEARHALRKWTRYVSLGLVVLWMLLLYSRYTNRDAPFFLFLIGLFLAGVAISLRDVFSNVVGWMVIVSSKGLQAGDRIKVGETCGDVIDVGIFRTVLAEIGDWVGADQSTGRLVSIPNSKVLSHEIINYTAGYDFIWHEMKVLVTFESDWECAERILQEIADEDFRQTKSQIQERLKRARQRYLLRYNYISPKVYVRIVDSGVELSLRYMVRVRRRRTAEDAVARKVLQRFSREPQVEFAYPTIRLFRNGEQATSPQSVPGEPGR